MLGWTNLVWTRLYHHLKVDRRPCLPTVGPAILICNHTSGLDPMFLQSCCSRLIIWMMAREYYEIRALKWAFRTIEAIPVDRNGRDFAATRAAFRALEQGRVVGIFPEGRIETTKELLPFHTGVALMAIKSKAPVFPAFLDGSQRNKEMVSALLRPNQARVSFGPEIIFDRSDISRPVLEAATAKMRDAVNMLAAEMKARI